jgi:hypothetical protein
MVRAGRMLILPERDAFLDHLNVVEVHHQGDLDALCPEEPSNSRRMRKSSSKPMKAEPLRSAG